MQPNAMLLTRIKSFLPRMTSMSRPVDQQNWRRCRHCTSLIPVVFDWRLQPDGSLSRNDTYSYVCPYCDHCHVGGQCCNNEPTTQRKCFECNTDLHDQMHCPKCSFPRGWVRVRCPTCSHDHPVHAPHWDVHCDLFHLECVYGMTVFDSLCIC